VTSDVVSAWGADGVTPTWATNWTAENTPQNLAPSNTWTRYSITATLDTASTNNVAVFIWCDDMTTTLGDFLYITDVQLEVGSLPTPFERKTFSQVVSECQRYYEKSYDLATALGTATDTGAAWGDFGSHADATSISPIPFKVTKRTSTYSVSFWTTSGTANNWAFARNGLSADTIPVAFSKGQSSMNCYIQTGAAWIVALRSGHWTVDAEL
jgi:hypothetical protein